jgi:hypothetical protein
MIHRTIKLKDIVFGYSELSKQSDAEFLRLWRIAFKGFKFMGLNGFWQPKTISIPVNKNQTATLPADYIQWVKIGCFNHAGEIQTLRVNENLTTFKDTDSDRLKQIKPEITELLPSFLSDAWFADGMSYYGDGEDVCDTSQNFGVGSRLIQPGECKVDEVNNCVVLGTQYQYPYIILEYISSPEKDDDYGIPIQFELAMEAFLAWQDIIYVPATGHVGNNNVAMRARYFKSQLAVAKQAYKPFRLQEATQTFIESQILGIKAG